MIYAFDHTHKPGDICCRLTCKHARRAPVLSDCEVLPDLPMRIIRTATSREYLEQPIPDGWMLPPLESGCEHVYEVEILPRSR